MEESFSECFDLEFQDKILGCLFRVGEFCAVAVPFLSSSYFDGVMRQNIAGLVLDHFRSFNCCMSRIAFIRELLLKVKAREDAVPYVDFYNEIAGSDFSDYKYILENLVLWVKKQKWRKFVELAVSRHLADDMVPDFDRLEKEAKSIIGISSVCESRAYDYFSRENIINRAKKRLSDLTESAGIRTGIAELDMKFYGRGFMPGELYLVLAPPKRGKSMSLLWFANSAALRKKNVVHFTCEVSTHICTSRLDALNSNVMFYDLPKSGEAVAREVIDKIPDSGQLKMFEYPTKTLTSAMIEDRLKNLSESEGFIPDILFVDYLDLLRPVIRSDNVYNDQARISEELRGIAGKFNIPVVTASQINRGGASKELTAGSDVAGSYEKIAVADQVITLSATDDDLRSNRLKIHLSESRNNESAVLNIETDFSRGRFFKQFLSAV